VGGARLLQAAEKLDFLSFLKGRTFRCAVKALYFLVIPSRLQSARDLLLSYRKAS
jgi:hypothetical protein